VVPPTLLTIDPCEPDERALAAAAEVLRAGGLVAFPTETVYGLGANALDGDAVGRVFAAKGRPADNPLIVHAPDAASAWAVVAATTPLAERLAARFWPGPLTLVLPCKARLASGVARADGAVGFRCSPHPTARALAALAAARAVGPLTATSLNRSGAPAARTRAEAEAVCGRTAASEPAPALVAGAEAGGGPASSVVDATGELPVLLREGALPAAALAEAAGVGLAS
jgi:L-threonylcarbamoyladenylate synthase